MAAPRQLLDGMDQQAYRLSKSARHDLFDLTIYARKIDIGYADALSLANKTLCTSYPLLLPPISPSTLYPLKCLRSHLLFEPSTIDNHAMRQ